MKKILVIEDEPRTRNLYLECLKTEGYYTIGGENGLIGVQLAQEQLPDLVICDIVMPQLDGYGVLTTLRQNPVTAIIPFIFVTARVTKAERRQGMKLGADDYIIKPCTVEELLGAIAAQLEKRAALQQWYTAQSQKVAEPPSADIALATAPKDSPDKDGQPSLSYLLSLNNAGVVQGCPSLSRDIVPPKSILPSIPQMSEVFDFIEANYHQPITLGDVARAVGYSRGYLTELVRSQTGQTVNRWIVERRMAETRSLLLQTDQSVEEIAAAVGYQNACHFFRQFRQHHGETPQAWRKAHLPQFSTKQNRNNC